jgi:hypothetical protein
MQCGRMRLDPQLFRSSSSLFNCILSNGAPQTEAAELPRIRHRRVGSGCYQHSTSLKGNSQSPVVKDTVMEAGGVLRE